MILEITEALRFVLCIPYHNIKRNKVLCAIICLNYEIIVTSPYLFFFLISTAYSPISTLLECPASFGAKIKSHLSLLTFLKPVFFFFLGDRACLYYYVDRLAFNTLCRPGWSHTHGNLLASAFPVLRL